MSRLFESFFKKIGVYLEVTKASGIARRYSTINLLYPTILERLEAQQVS